LGVSEETTLRLPDIPKWTIRNPSSNLNSRYFARRVIPNKVWPSKVVMISLGIGSRSFLLWTFTVVTRRPFNNRDMPVFVVSTSGSSGIGLIFCYVSLSYSSNIISRLKLLMISSLVFA